MATPDIGDARRGRNPLRLPLSSSSGILSLRGCPFIWIDQVLLTRTSNAIRSPTQRRSNGAIPVTDKRDFGIRNDKTSWFMRYYSLKERPEAVIPSLTAISTGTL